MFFPTDILRAALCCVADDEEKRTYLRGVRITPTHILATDGRAAVRMEHGAETEIDGVFIFNGYIPDEAEGTFIGLVGSDWYAVHLESVNEESRYVGGNLLTHVECRYPDFCNLLPGEPEPCEELPIFASNLLALPHLMFGRGVPVRFKPFGKSAPCVMLVDPVTNHFYGNPMLVIMPLQSNVFELCAAVLNEKN